MSTNELRESMQINVAEKLEETRQAIAFLRGMGTDVPVEAIELLHIMERCVAAESRISSEYPPDDDTPIDEAWLLAVGFCDCLNFRYEKLFLVNTVVAVALKAVNGGWRAQIEAGNSRNLNATRGQLRRLCKSLGIELKEWK